MENMVNELASEQKIDKTWLGSGKMRNWSETRSWSFLSDQLPIRSPKYAKGALKPSGEGTLMIQIGNQEI